ncbi:MAG: hypothetical protein QXL51_01080 [Candidatus Aenigmatarchaeota archaeon]
MNMEEISICEERAFCYLLGVKKWNDAVKIIKSEYAETSQMNVEEFSQNFADLFTPIYTSDIFRFYAENPNMIYIVEEAQELVNEIDFEKNAQNGIYYFICEMVKYILEKE